MEMTQQIKDPVVFGTNRAHGNIETTLYKAINAASTVHCNGFELEEFEWREKEVVLSCGDFEATLADQTITVVDGEAKLTDPGDGCEFNFEFRVSRPLCFADL